MIDGTRCAVCSGPCAMSDARDGKQLCFRCLRYLTPFEGDCTDAMIERVQAKIVENTLRGAGIINHNNQTILPLPLARVDAGSSHTVTVMSQIVCKPRVLRLTDDAASAFIIEDIRVGHLSQLPVSGSVAGKFFAESYQNRFGYIPMDIDVVRPAVQFSMTIRNCIGISATFAALWEVDVVDNDQ